VNGIRHLGKRERVRVHCHRHRKLIRLKREHEIRCIELAIAVPITFLEFRVTSDTVFVFSALKDGDQVR
jgi:hypothetical protein